MNTPRLSLALLAAALMMQSADDVFGQTTYRHPHLPFQFEAPGAWTQVAHPEDPLIYHMVSSGGELNVMLWYTKTEQEAEPYIAKMADMKGYQVLGAVSREKLPHGDVWVLQAAALGRQEEHRVILGAFASADGLYIVQIWCPLERYEEERGTMGSILESVDVVP